MATRRHREERKGAREALLQTRGGGRRLGTVGHSAPKIYHLFFYINFQSILIITAVLTATTMSMNVRIPWDLLENRRATAFLIAGLLWLVDTTLLFLDTFADVSVLGTRGPVNPVLYVSGLVVAMVGLLGFYPGLVNRTRRLARLSAGVIAVAGIAWPILLAWVVVATLLNLPGPPVFSGIMMFVVLALGFILFGIASVRTGVPSRVAGILVLAIPTAIVGWITLGFAVYGGDVPPWMAPTIAGVVTVLLLAIGVRLHTEDIPTDRTKPSPGMTSK